MMNITDCKYMKTEIGAENVAIKATIDNVQMTIPLDPANTDYAEIMRQVDAGELTIEEAE